MTLRIYKSKIVWHEESINLRVSVTLSDSGTFCPSLHEPQKVYLFLLAFLWLVLYREGGGECGFWGYCPEGWRTPRPSDSCTRPPGSIACPVPDGNRQEDVYGDSKWAGSTFQTGAGRYLLAGLEAAG